MSSDKSAAFGRFEGRSPIRPTSEADFGKDITLRMKRTTNWGKRRVGEQSPVRGLRGRDTEGGCLALGVQKVVRLYRANP